MFHFYIITQKLMNLWGWVSLERLQASHPWLQYKALNPHVGRPSFLPGYETAWYTHICIELILCLSILSNAVVQTEAPLYIASDGHWRRWDNWDHKERRKKRLISIDINLHDMQSSKVPVVRIYSRILHGPTYAAHVQR